MRLDDFTPELVAQLNKIAESYNYHIELKDCNGKHLNITYDDTVLGKDVAKAYVPMLSYTTEGLDLRFKDFTIDVHRLIPDDNDDWLLTNLSLMDAKLFQANFTAAILCCEKLTKCLIDFIYSSEKLRQSECV